MLIQLVALVAAVTLATLMTSQVLLWVYAVCFGIMMGGGGAFDGTVWVNLFGREHQGLNSWFRHYDPGYRYSHRSDSLRAEPRCDGVL